MSKDVLKGADRATVQSGMGCVDKGFWNDRWLFHKYASEEDYANNNPFEVSVVDKGNVLLNTGINAIWNLVAGEAEDAFDSGDTLIGVGDDNEAAVATQTDLEAETNKTYKGMEGGYPQVGSDQKFVARAVFGADDANYDWHEFVIKNDDSDVCLNRLVSVQGTKAQDQVWTITLEILLT